MTLQLPGRAGDPDVQRVLDYLARLFPLAAQALADGSVTTAKIANDAVTAAKIAADAVGSSEIAADAVGSSEIAADAVGTSEIAADAVTASEIATDAVGIAEISAAAETAIANQAIVPTTIADGETFTVPSSKQMLWGEAVSIDGTGALVVDGSFIDANETPATKLHTTTATTSGPTTTSATFATLAEMTVTANFNGNPVICNFTGRFEHTAANGQIFIELYNNGTLIASTDRIFQSYAAGTVRGSIPLTHAFTPATGTRTLDIRWATSGATATAETTNRQFSILELKQSL